MALADLQESRPVPGEGPNRDGGGVRVIDVEAAGFLLPLRSRTTERSGGREDERAPRSLFENLELAALCDPGLMDVPADHELGTGRDESTQDVVATAEWQLARDAPGWRRQMVVQCDHAQGIGRAFLKPLRPEREAVVVDRTSLLAPRANRVEPDDDDVIRDVERLGRAEDTLPLVERARESCREGVRNVVVAGYDEEGQVQRAQELRSDLELDSSASVREVTRGHEQLGLEVLDERTQRVEWLPCFRVTAHVQVGEVEESGGHRRGRLYTRNVAEESPELFDDIYLGLRAGGAAAKQRRGEPLSNEEEEAISRWRRLSLWRKTIAVGAFALGTFGLGFTVGGLVFGRSRKA